MLFSIETSQPGEKQLKMKMKLSEHQQRVLDC